MNKYDIAIIGAGPAGIMAAITASRLGRSVILIDKNKIIGRKILATGNGRCNLTNRFAEVARYHGGKPEFIGGILSQFDQQAVMKFFGSLGIILKEEDRGRIFPRTNQATTVLEALTHELQRLRVTIKTECEIKVIEYRDNWQIRSTDGTEFRAKKLILTTGGKAAHQFGSSGDGLFFAGKLGHKITPIYAALVPIETEETWTKDIQGLKIEGTARVVVNGEKVGEREGDILFTHYGLSGPAIMGLARAAAPFVEDGGVEIYIDTVPEEDIKGLDNKIIGIFGANGARVLKNALAGIVPSNLALVVLKNAGIDPDKKAAQISKSDRMMIVKTLKSLILKVKKIRPLKEAQVTAGGIVVDEIEEKTLQSRIMPNLFFAGEIIDVDGDSGGFNLQWAWSSGYVSGKGAAQN